MHYKFPIGKGQECGGMLEGDNGKFRYSPRQVLEGKNPLNCVWLVQVYGATQIQLTLDDSTLQLLEL